MSDEEREKYPSELAERFQVRLPPGLRDRIKAAAERNNRSMNAEIVATLDEAYPAPIPVQLVFPFSGLGMLALNWHMEAWRFVDWNTWERFRAGDLSSSIYLNRSDVTGHFVIAVFDEDGRLCNIILHNYLISDSGYKDAGFERLTKAEQEDYKRLMVATTATNDDGERLRNLRDKMEPAYNLPKASITKLREVLMGFAAAEIVDDLLRSRGLIA